MLIRSQGKEVIINFDNLKTVRTGGYSGNSIIVFTESETLKIGEYSTEEKAIKVLDMIQKKYEGFIATERNGVIVNVLDAPKVFEMPQDSEV